MLEGERGGEGKGKGKGKGCVSGRSVHLLSERELVVDGPPPPLCLLWHSLDDGIDHSHPLLHFKLAPCVWREIPQCADTTSFYQAL